MLATVWLSLSSAPASACEYEASPLGFILDGDGADATPPSNPTLSDLIVERGRWTLIPGGSCKPLGALSFGVEAEDDWSDVGYVVELVSGDLPDGMTIAPVPFAANGGRLTFVWWDSAGDPFDATLTVTAVDRSGNEGLPGALPISDPGRSGCAVAGSPSAILGFAGILLVARRRLPSERRR